MFRYRATVLTLMLGAAAVTSGNVEGASEERATVSGVSSSDVMPTAGGGVELHACRDVGEDGPYSIVEFGPSTPGEASGVHLIVDEAPAHTCAHLVVFTQPQPTQPH
jgi:hypothetical protein